MNYGRPVFAPQSPTHVRWEFDLEKAEEGELSLNVFETIRAPWGFIIHEN